MSSRLCASIAIELCGIAVSVHSSIQLTALHLHLTLARGGCSGNQGQIAGADRCQPRRAPLQTELAANLATEKVVIKGSRIPPHARREFLELAPQLSWTTTKGSGSPQPTSTTGAATQVGWLVGWSVGWLVVWVPGGSAHSAVVGACSSWSTGIRWSSWRTGGWCTGRGFRVLRVRGAGGVVRQLIAGQLGIVLEEFFVVSSTSSGSRSKVGVFVEFEDVDSKVRFL